MTAQEVADFQTEVIQRSHETPVLVDFWAEWCGPCRMLGPVLERLAAENDGSWTLAKVNVDEHPSVARDYAIQSIPAVKLFLDGKVAQEFIGALPEPQVRKWLADAIPSENGRRLTEASSLLDQGDLMAARDLLEELLQDNPAHAAARVLLARIVALSRPREATQLIADLQDYPPEQRPTVEAVQTIGRLAVRRAQFDGLEQIPAAAHYVRGIDALNAGDTDGALECFVDVVRKDRKLDDDGARKACLALFRLLGDQHPLTKKHRRALEMALF